MPVNDKEIEVGGKIAADVKSETIRRRQVQARQYTGGPIQIRDRCHDAPLSRRRQESKAKLAASILHSVNPLLKSDRLDQIARAVHVQASSHGHVIGKQLQWHNLEYWQQKLRSIRNKNSVISKTGNLRITFGCKRDHPA